MWLYLANVVQMWPITRVSHGSNLVNSSYAHAKVSRGDLRSKSILGVYLREDKTMAGTAKAFKLY